MTREDEALVLNLAGARGAAFGDTLEKIRAIPGRRFDGDRKVWTVAATVTNAERLLHSIDDLVVAPDLREWIKLSRVKESADLTTKMPDDADLKLLWASALYPYQRAMIDRAAKVQRLIIADDMGLGKTVQALGTVREYQARQNVSVDGPKLVVCPNSVKGVWAREIELWLGTNEPYQIVDAPSPAKRGQQLDDIIAANGWAIVNWEQLRTKKETLKLKNGGTKTVEFMKQPIFEDTEWFAAIADEAHRAKSRKAAQTRGLWRVQATIQLGLTGTPLMNTPDELWAILRWLWPQDYHERGRAFSKTARSYWAFYEEYVDYTEGFWGKEINGVKNPDALRFELKDRLARRTKGEVLSLPSKTRVIVPVDMPAAQRKLYDKAAKEIWLEIAKDEKLKDASFARVITIPNGAARMVRLQQILEHPRLLDAAAADASGKLDACEEMILDNAQESHVVYTKFVETANIFAERLRSKDLKVGVYTGEVQAKHRTVMEEDFQNGDLDVIVGTIEALKEGITLTAARTEHFLTRSWVPAVNEQAEDRCHRVGQHHPVTIYIYEVPGSVDDGNVRPTNIRKERIVSTVLPKDHINQEAYDAATP